MPPTRSVATLRRPGTTPLIDLDEEQSPLIGFPGQTDVVTHHIEDFTDEWPESDSLIGYDVEVSATAVEVVRPFVLQELAITGPVPLQNIFRLMLSEDYLWPRTKVHVPDGPSAEAKIIARRLEEAREVLGVTMADVASAVGVSRATLFAWANGATVPRPPTRRELDRLFGITGVATQVFSRQGAREWFAEGTPSRVGRLMSGDAASVGHELDALVSSRPRGQRPARFEPDEEPEKLDEGR